MNIIATITGIKYKPFLTNELNQYSYSELKKAISNDTAFIINFNKEKSIALSWWKSAKRTRTYPYERVYNTLNFQGKKATIIPVVKDEGFDGDRDYLQWDTVSLMSLLGVYTIITFYITAEINEEYDNKITNQIFSLKHIKKQIDNLLIYQSDALHWNLEQTS